MTKTMTVSIALAGALMLAACGQSAQTNETDNSALVNFDAPVEDNALAENGLDTVDANAAVDTNSLDNAAQSGGNAL